MGYWGFRIFQSDHACDLICEIEVAAGLKLYPLETRVQTIRARVAFNEGLLYRLVAKYETEIEKKDTWSGRNHKVILVIALAMQTGANLEDEIRTKGKAIMTTLGIPGTARLQMNDALEKYKDGEAWVFDSPGLAEQMKINMGSAHTHCSRGFWLTSPRPGGYGGGGNQCPKISCCPGEHVMRITQSGTQEFETPIGALGLCLYCRKPETTLDAEGKEHRRCGGCKDDRFKYCSGECQKKDWQEGGHKPICGGTPKEASRYVGKKIKVEGGGEVYFFTNGGLPFGLQGTEGYIPRR